jgi:nuclear transcription Y subunit beta
MKEALPKDAKISKEARETVQECVSEYISFITSEACDRCRGGNRKTINGDDLLFALNQLGFEHYIGNLQAYYSKYKEAQKHAEGGGRIGGLPSDAVNQAHEAVERIKRGGVAGGDSEEDLEDEEDEDIEDEDEEEAEEDNEEEEL